MEKEEIKKKMRKENIKKAICYTIIGILSIGIIVGIIFAVKKAIEWLLAVVSGGILIVVLLIIIFKVIPQR